MRHEVETNRKTFNTEFDLGTIAVFKYHATKQNRLFVFGPPTISPQFKHTPQQIRQSSNIKQYRARAHIACRTLDFNVNVPAERREAPASRLPNGTSFKFRPL